MPALPNPSRRHALKILAGAPMLPLSGVALPALLSLCLILISEPTRLRRMGGGGLGE